MNIRYIDTNNPIARIYYVDDLVKYNLVDYSIINQTKNIIYLEMVYLMVFI